MTRIRCPPYINPISKHPLSPRHSPVATKKQSTQQNTKSESLHEILDRVIAKEATTEELIAAIKSGADVNAKNELKETPLNRMLHYAAPKEKTVRTLIDAGADINDEDEYGDTPLHIAVAACDDEGVVRALLEAGADVNARNKHDVTPLHRVRYAQAAKILINAGAEVNAKDNHRWTPLHHVVFSKTKVDVVRALIKGGADVTIKDYEHNTPLNLAETKSIRNVLEKAMEEAAAKKKE